MSARFPSEADPLAVAATDALPPVESIRFSEPALDRVDEPNRHHKPLDVSALDPDPTPDDPHPRDLPDRDDRDDPDRDDADDRDNPDVRHNLNQDDREERENPDEHTAKADQNDAQDPTLGHEPQDATDKPDHAQPEPQESAHVTLGPQADEVTDQAQPPADHEHHQSVLGDHLEAHVDTGPTAHLTVLMPSHAQPLPPPPPMQSSPPQQPVKKKRKTYNTEEERRKARILKNRRTAEESRQRRMKRMKELEEYVASSAIREKELQEEARLTKVQLAAVRESMEQVVAQKDAEIATKDAEIQRLRDELNSR